MMKVKQRASGRADPSFDRIHKIDMVRGRESSQRGAGSAKRGVVSQAGNWRQSNTVAPGQTRLLQKGMPKSLSENSKGFCFRGKAGRARRDERAYPQRSVSLEATPPGRAFRENPSGGGSFACGLRWLVPYSPLRGCAELAALATAKISSRRTPFNFQTGSKADSGRDLIRNRRFSGMELVETQGDKLYP
jgi:hypothetical protein